MVDFIRNFVQSTGYLGVFLFTLIENYFPPIPEEVVLPFAGFEAQRGTLSFWGIVIAGTLGVTTGALGLFYIGRKVGEERFRAWAAKHGKWFTISPKDVDKLDAYFKRHGNLAVFIARMVPGVRSAVPFPAGFSGMSPVVFALYYGAAAFLWSLALTYAGFLLGQNYSNVERILQPYTYIMIGLAVAVYLYRLVRGHHDGKETSEPSGSESAAPAPNAPSNRRYMG